MRTVPSFSLVAVKTYRGVVGVPMVAAKDPLKVLARNGNVAVMVDPLIAKFTWLLLPCPKTTTLLPPIDDPAALIDGWVMAKEAVMVPALIEKETLFELANTRVPELIDDVPAENHFTRSDPSNCKVALWLEFQSEGRTSCVLIGSSAIVSVFMWKMVAGISDLSADQGHGVLGDGVRSRARHRER